MICGNHINLNPLSTGLPVQPPCEIFWWIWQSGILIVGHCTDFLMFSIILTKNGDIILCLKGRRDGQIFLVDKGFILKTCIGPNY